MARGPIVLTTLLLFLAPASVRASSPAADAAREAADDGVARLERARELTSTGSLADAFRAAASLSDLAAEPAAAAPASLPAALPESLAWPVARILGAIDAVSALGRAAVGPGVRDLFDELTSAFVNLRDAETLAHDLARLQPRIDRTVDRDQLAAAGMTITSALDDALPALRAYAATLAPSTARVVGCDVADAAPVLCIGHTGANTYTADYALLIDLGGDDTYANGGGAGLPFTNSLAASVVIDLGGDDTYAATVPRISTNLGAHAAQGVGWFGGTGVLVDAAGNDLYTVNIKEQVPVQPFSPWPIYAQAYSAAGVGILADLAGDDRFEISNRATVDHAWVQAQGYATLGGISLFLDRAGNDTHLIEGAPKPFVDANGVPHAGSGQAMGFGDGAAGSALFVDAAGDDTMTAHARAGTLAEDVTGNVYGGGAHAFGFGAGLIGDGVALLGPGKQTLKLHAEASGPRPGFGSTLGYGFGTLGFGGLDDAGGNDVYEALSDVSEVRRVTLHDSCECAGLLLEDPYGQSANGQTHGVGIFGVGALVDRGGDDQYLTTARATSDVVFRDERTRQFPPPDAEAPTSLDVTAGANNTYVTAQGDGGSGSANLFGVPAFIHGAGVLRDAAGADTYRIDASAGTTLQASSAIDAPITTRVDPVDSWVWGQAASHGVDFFGQNPPASYGELRDEAGADTYSSSAASSATSEPATAEPIGGEVRSSVQASVDKNTVAFFRDLGGGADAMTAVPADPACEGTRGQGVWVDCGTLYGRGENT